MTQWREASFSGTQGANITTSNTPTLARTSGTAATFDSATAKTGMAAKVQTSGSLSLNEFDYTAVEDAWHVFYLNIVAYPSANTSFAAVWNGTTAAASNLRLNSAGEIQLRNGSFTLQSTSTALDLGLHRLAYRVRSSSVGAGGLELRIYSGSNIDGTTPSQTITGSSASGPTTVSNFRFGCTTSGTINVAFDEFHIGDVEWTPTPADPESEAHFSLTATYDDDTATFDYWTVDPTDSVGTVDLTQISGTTATITPNTPSAGLYKITNPSGTDNLVFNLEADSDGTPDNVSFTLLRGGTVENVERPAIYVKTSAGWM